MVGESRWSANLAAQFGNSRLSGKNGGKNYFNNEIKKKTNKGLGNGTPEHRAASFDK